MGFQDVVLAAKNKTIVRGTVVNAYDVGVAVDYLGNTVFVPKSLTGLFTIDDLTHLTGKQILLKIIEVDAEKARALGSVIEVVKEKCSMMPQLEYLETGKVYSGIVESIGQYGAFVNVCGITGLVHISRLGIKHITHPLDVVMVGESVEVTVDEINSENGRVFLSKNVESKEVDVLTTIEAKKHQNVDHFAEENEGLDELISQLNELTGLNNVKYEVTSLINLLKIQRLRQKQGFPMLPVSLHLVFSGNPGTGKTTVARLLAKIYHALGVLSKGQLIEVDRSGLVGGYVGQTAIKTQEVIQQAMGGVLFIDEAYTLSRGESSVDYGQEAIDTILKGMEDNREDLIVIVAGYPNLMKQFVNSNPGLKSRFNKYIHFEDYTPSELLDIFEGMCKKSGYTVDETAKDWVLQYFQKRYEERDETFANGRDVRNFFEKAVMNQANRLATMQSITEKDITQLCVNDFSHIDN